MKLFLKCAANRIGAGIEKCGYLNITRLGGSYLTPAQEEIEFDQRVPIMLTPAVVVRFFLSKRQDW